jgi:L-gulonate 3-dehydrogenase
MNGTTSSAGTVALIGCGLVGRGWAILFAQANFRVQMFDASAPARGTALDELRVTLGGLVRLKLVRDATQILEHVTVCTSLDEAVSEASYIQESIFENAAAKRNVFTELTNKARADAILASSCSTIPPDDFLSGLRLGHRCVVAHPFNPPHVVPLVEILGSSQTSAATIEATTQLMIQLGQTPVLIRKPVIGYVVNRLQAAVIAEALHLVEDDVISPQDLDACMKHGLGRRWAFMGPFETMDLNSVGGLKDYVDKYYEDAYRPICADIDVTRPWSAEAVDRANAWLRVDYPDEKALRERRAWRDEMLAKIAVFLRQCDQSTGDQ